MRTLLSRIQALFRARALDARLDEEVQSHLEELAAEYVRRGTTPEQARLAARRAFGGVEQMKEMHRDHRTFGLLIDCARDVRFGLRLLVKERWFTAVAVLVLALGIAANNTVFVLLNGLLLRDLPFADPDRIVTIRTSVGGRARPNAGISYLDLQDWSAAQRTFDGLAGVAETTMNVADEGRVPERSVGAYVSANAFDLIGHAPIVGRGFDARDDRPGAPAVVILGDALWRSRYGADPGVIGRTIRVNGVPSTVIGVMHGGLRFPDALTAVATTRATARRHAGAARCPNAPGPRPAAPCLRRANRRPTISVAVPAALATAYPATNRDVQPGSARFASARLAAACARPFRSS